MKKLDKKIRFFIYIIVILFILDFSNNLFDSINDPFKDCNGCNEVFRKVDDAVTEYDYDMSKFTEKDMEKIVEKYFGNVWPYCVSRNVGLNKMTWQYGGSDERAMSCKLIFKCWTCGENGLGSNAGVQELSTKIHYFKNN